VLEGVIPLETFPLVEWQKGELANVPSFTVLKTQICVTRPQCVKITSISTSHPTTLQHYNTTTQDFTTKINKEIVMEFSAHIVQ